ncbi:unnamed protein product [Lactuca virosa]|uniref:Uncharacterized protein n=1 Tax=Lactuca virosa TaxID=75947 RepID=A0AAU9NT09_9ASTR|nr:unnamed protein product [Lactuca virosa]
MTMMTQTVPVSQEVKGQVSSGGSSGTWTSSNLRDSIPKLFASFKSWNHDPSFVVILMALVLLLMQAIKKLGPTLLTVAEQDTNHNWPFFLGRFLESLHYYSVIFDSLEARMGRNSMERMKIERNHFAEACQPRNRPFLFFLAPVITPYTR